MQNYKFDREVKKKQNCEKSIKEAKPRFSLDCIAIEEEEEREGGGGGEEEEEEEEDEELIHEYAAH